MREIILASQSPRRKQLLEWAEIEFEVLVSHTDESFPEALSPTAAALHIAKQKAVAVAAKALHKTVIAADTIVVLNEAIIGKPKSRQDAIQTLKKLSGRKHQVITAVVILSETNQTAFTEITSVEFYPLTQKQIEHYVDRYQPYDKAGAYAIQEWIGVVGIKAIDGDFYNVMGLPVSRVVKALAEHG